MAPLDAPSPTPSTLPASGVKRPRPSAAGGGAAGASSRTKRRKAEDGTDADETGAGGGRGKNPVNFGVGMVKGREDEWGEPADVVTKVSMVLRSGFASPRRLCRADARHHAVPYGGCTDRRSISTPSRTRRCTGIWNSTTCYRDGTPRRGRRNLALRVG